MDAKSASQLSFEDSLAQLEKIVDSMESGDVPLAELITKFEQGNLLLQSCESRLKEAELKIEVLKKQNGSPALARFDVEKES